MLVPQDQPPPYLGLGIFVIGVIFLIIAIGDLFL